MMRIKWIRMILCLVLCVSLLSGCVGEKTVKYTNTDFAMGTTISEVLYGNEDACEEAGTKIITLLKEMEEQQISWRKKGSQIYKINHTKEPVVVDAEVFRWMQKSLQIAKDTDGALNPGIGTLAKLWDIGGEHPRVPRKAEIKEALTKIDDSQITLQKHTVVTNPDQVQVDLGAVGKGIAADHVMEFLKEETSIQGGIVSVGGSLCVYGEKDDGSDWEVGVQDPRGKTGEMAGSVTVPADSFVSTSGDYEKYIEQDGKRYHHILDSKTGYPSQSGLISVTIVSESGIDSDALSTACFVLGIKKSLPLLEKYQAEAVFIDQDHNIYLTDGVKFELKNADDYQLKE